MNSGDHVDDVDPDVGELTARFDGRAVTYGFARRGHASTGVARRLAAAGVVNGPLLVLHPDFAARRWNIASIWQACGYARLIMIGPELEAVRRHLERRARITRPDRDPTDRMKRRPKPSVPVVTPSEPAADARPVRMPAKLRVSVSDAAAWQADRAGLPVSVGPRLFSEGRWLDVIFLPLILPRTN